VAGVGVHLRLCTSRKQHAVDHPSEDVSNDDGDTAQYAI
jgi:hypothetical protein